MIRTFKSILRTVFTSPSSIPPQAGGSTGFGDGIRFPPVYGGIKGGHKKTVRTIIKCKETEKIFTRQRSRKLPGNIQQVAVRKLYMLNRSIALKDLQRFPANHLEKLRGDRSGQYSIRINDQWRICFEWHEGDAYNVEIVDYH